MNECVNIHKIFSIDEIMRSDLTATLWEAFFRIGTRENNFLVGLLNHEIPQDILPLLTENGINELEIHETKSLNPPRTIWSIHKISQTLG